jgi:hypothetical protein
MSDMARRRMYAQRLWGPPLRGPEEVVGAFGAMQAQEFHPAKWMVAQRTRTATDALVDKLFAEGAILRTHVLRPTWHFVRREDARWLLAVTRPRIERLNAPYYRQTGLDDALMARCQDIFRSSLEGGRHLTRPELAAALGAEGIDASGMRMSYIMIRSELDAVVISGAPRGKQQTYALFDERVPDRTTVDLEQGLAELAARYFTMHGPATAKDFAVWASLTVGEARRGAALCGDRLEQSIVDGRAYYAAPGRRRDTTASPAVDLIQVYDEAVMSYSESRGAMFRGGVAPSPTFMHTVLLDGHVHGSWKPRPSRESVVVDAALHDRPSAAVRASLDAAAARYGEFLGRPVTVVVG